MGYKRGIAITLDNMGTIASQQGKYESANQLYKESLEILGDIEDKYGMGISLSNQGQLALKSFEFEKAQKLHKESLMIFLETGNKKYIVKNIFLLAQILEMKGLYKESVILEGFICNEQEYIKYILATAELNSYENRLLKLKEKLGDEAFSKYWEEGKKLTLDQAAELALSNE